MVTMPRCNLTLRQKSQIIELSGELNTDQLARKFRVHPTTVTRTLKKKSKILDQISRVNVNFKTVQTSLRNEEHDALVLDYIRTKQNLNEPLTIKEICDKAAELAGGLDRCIKSKRGWWRRFKIRCNIIRSRLHKELKNSTSETQKIDASKRTSVKKSTKCKSKNEDSTVMRKEKSYTFKVRESSSNTTGLIPGLKRS